MPKINSTYLDSLSADSSDLEVKAVIAVLAQRLLEKQQEALAARNRQIAEQANSYEKSAIQADAGRAARDIHERILLASERSISKLYQSGGLTPHTYGAQETVAELKRLGWTD